LVSQEKFPRLHHQVCFGKSGGKIIWQPRIGAWFTDKIFDGSGLPSPYSGMDLYELYRALGVSARLYEFNSCFHRVEHPQVYFKEEALNKQDTRITVHTPVGKQLAVQRRFKESWYYHNVKFEVETPEELKVATWREENATWEWDQQQYDAWIGKAGDLGAPTMYMPRMNVQCLYLEKMGVDKGIMAIYEWPEEIGQFFRALEENQERLINVINQSPIDIINFGENIHSGTLSVDLFLKYHLPECQRRCEKLHTAGKFICSHWDGDTKPLLRYAKETGLDGIEAITPVPQGDVTLEEIKTALGDEMVLLDGIPAIYFNDTFSVETLVECTKRLIGMFAPKLVLGISDEIASTGDIERIRIVDDIVQRYNSQFDRGDLS